MKIRSLAVILPEKYRGGTLRGALNIARMIKIGSEANSAKLDVCFGYVDDSEIYSESDFSVLKDLNIIVRPFKKEYIDSNLFNEIYKLNGKSVGGAYKYLSFNDGISNFDEYDFILLVSDRLDALLPPHKRYGVVVYDYIQRYIPEIFGKESKFDGNWTQYELYSEVTRNADLVITTTEQTRLDCINYVGANPENVGVYPQEFDPIDEINSIRIKNKKQIIWTTNSTQHKNHLNILEGLNSFLGTMIGSEWSVIITGVYTHLFSDEKIDDQNYEHPYCQKVRKKIGECVNLKGRLNIRGNLSDDAYISALSESSILLHGSLYDNGTYSILEAANLGIPSVSTDYPAIRECSANFGVFPELFDGYNPDSLCDALVRLVTNYETALNNIVISKQSLSKRTFEKIAPSFYNKLMNYVSKIDNG